jgi:hypothetical protein
MSDERLGFQPLDERLKFPELNQDSFNQIVNTAREARLFGFPKKALDRMYEFWLEMDGFTDGVLRMDKAMRLPGVPEKEKAAAKKYLDDLVVVAEPISASLREFFIISEDQRSWKKDSKPIYDAIKKYDDSDDVGKYEHSITALLETISETKGSGWKTEQEMRQKIAQHALEELWVTCDYAQFYYAADVDIDATTIDDFNQEKSEFIAALNGDFWNESQLEKNKKAVSALRKVLEDVDDEIYPKYLDILWKTAKGKAKKETTAIDIIIAAEEIFQGLKDEGAFEWDPDDEYDEDEDVEEMDE